MADENQEQISEQEQGQEQEQEQEQKQGQDQERGEGEEPVQEPAEDPQDKPAEEIKNKDGLLMPILYALLAAVGVFTLIMIAGIVVTILTRPAQPSETPSAEPSAGIIETQSP